MTIPLELRGPGTGASLPEVSDSTRRAPGREEAAADTLWYKDAIVYEAHVRTFFDSNGDGIGDFPGMTQKLDYLQELGITCLWLLPFYPSPLRDDGYDIAHYQGIHPAYGTMRDFRTFLREAHRRGIRVLTELVVNHTSDQHPWFQAARRAPAGSSKRDFYVWSDTKRKYREVRVIFTDSETSNWAWDEEARAYYWHRFFAHQPDLNFDNPKVVQALLRVLRFWLDAGVDGMRLDAVPYLIERDGTNCENLPETHTILRQLRREVDRRYTGRVLLAEANQWPADVRPYFGDGDECHMAYHFPLMPRIFMALRQEDRHPITEILRQTPEIPDVCQWALFLRNHDEMTLEMVTDEERDYMYRAYAADPQMRLNVGIRRRLAPLMDNNRRRIELLNSLLFSLPGTPIIYYGDEIGMGDNIYLGDRNGVRTPMQWTGDRNAGFSKADPARLYAPVIMDPVYSYQAINVEAQERSPASLLNWMRRMIALRRQHRTFGRGSYEFLYPDNRKVLAFLRRCEDEVILVVANLSRFVQPVELDLSAWRDHTPLEMLGLTEFPRIGDRPYFLTLGPYGFYWFRLQERPAPIAARLAPDVKPAVEPAKPLLAGPAWDGVLDGHVRTLIEQDVLLPFLLRQRWFAGKARAPRSCRFVDWSLSQRTLDPMFLTIVEVEYRDGSHDRYFVPLVLKSGPAGEAIQRDYPQAVIAPIAGARRGALCDATVDEDSALALLGALAEDREFQSRRGALRAWTLAGFDIEGERPAEGWKVRRGSAEQSNTSVLYGSRFILKLFRRLEPGVNPDLEVGRHLTERAHFPRVPALYGALEYDEGGAEPTTLGLLQSYVQSQADGWQHAVEDFQRYLERAEGRLPADVDTHVDTPLDQLMILEPPESVRDTIGGYLESAARLGCRTAEMHLAMASGPGAPAFEPQPMTDEDRAALAEVMIERGRIAIAALEAHAASLPEELKGRARSVVAARDRLLSRFAELSRLPIEASKIRVHGDYHLGQVLWSEGDFVIFDFEGEPSQPLAERRAKQLALKDVAGMLRSFSYAAFAGLFTATAYRPDDFARLERHARVWEQWCSATFLRAYLETAGGAAFLPADPGVRQRVLECLMLDKALYEAHYELNNRPDWLRIPLWGILPLIVANGGEVG